VSRFLSKTARGLEPYVPGEQLFGEGIVKLNTNEFPYPPPESVVAAAKNAAKSLQLYSSTDAKALREKIAETLPSGLTYENISVSNGSDEVLSFIFRAFFENGVVFPDITYGFYPVFASYYGISYREIPLDASLRILPADYCGINENIVLANPNAQTGTALALSDIEDICASNPNNIVVIDEAYADFRRDGASAVSLIGKFPNLIVVRTFSKSMGLAGARLGCAVSSVELIADIERVRFSFNPYNVNAMTQAAGLAALSELPFYREKCREIIATRAWFSEKLRENGFLLTDSQANFVFCEHKSVSGEVLQASLREKGFLVRRFSAPERIKNRLRITIGTPGDMQKLLGAILEIIGTKAV
jgi:histidinol-phosphate aminotransferase